MGRATRVGAHMRSLCRVACFAIGLAGASGAPAYSADPAPAGANPMPGPTTVVPKAKEDGADLRIFGDWKRLCETPSGAPAPVCYAFQKVNFAETNTQLLQVVVGYFRADVPDPLMIVTLPLGVFLPAGLEVMADGATAIADKYEVCLSDGCQAAIRLDETRAAALRRAKEADIVFLDAVRQKIVIPVSLKGFAAALDDLKASAPGG